LGVYVGKGFTTFPLLPSLILLTRRFPLFSSLLHLLEIFHYRNVLLQSSTDEWTSPSLLPPTSTLLAGTTLLMLITAQALPSINPVLRFPAFFLDSWPLKMRPIGCPETSERNYHYLLRNNPEERSSQTFLCFYVLIRRMHMKCCDTYVLHGAESFLRS